MKLLISILLLSITSCAVVKTPMTTGGSRSDGIIEMSYSYGGFDQPKVDWVTANNRAIEACKRWGYSDAESFGGTKSKCNNYSQYGCNGWNVEIKYQCINKKEDSTVTTRVPDRQNNNANEKDTRPLAKISKIYGISLGQKFYSKNFKNVIETADGWKIVNGLPTKPTSIFQNKAGILNNENGIYTIVIPSIIHSDISECRKSQRNITSILTKKYGDPTTRALDSFSWEGQAEEALATSPRIKTLSNREIELQFCAKENSSFLFRIVYYDKLVGKTKSKEYRVKTNLEDNL